MRVVKYWNRLSWEQAQLTNLTSEHLALRGRLHLEELKTPPVLTFSVFFASKFQSSCAFWRSSVKAQLPKPHICNEAFWCLLSNPEGTASEESEACCWVWCEQAPACSSRKYFSDITNSADINQNAPWSPANTKSNHIYSQKETTTMVKHIPEAASPELNTTLCCLGLTYCML